MCSIQLQHKKAKEDEQLSAVLYETPRVSVPL